MNILLIRHGMTEGNKKHRYIGITDEPLCPEGVEQLQKIRYLSRPDIVFASPMIRCRQTAQILFPGRKIICVPEFREMDFGIFENRCYQGDLELDPLYQQWVESRCEDPVPQGECKTSFTQRCAEGFRQAMALAGPQTWTAALVVHGGTIMSILSMYAEGGGEYYSFQSSNGHGYAGVWNGNVIRDLQRI